MQSTIQFSDQLRAHMIATLIDHRLVRGKILGRLSYGVVGFVDPWTMTDGKMTLLKLSEQELPCPLQEASIQELDQMVIEARRVPVTQARFGVGQTASSLYELRSYVQLEGYYLFDSTERVSSWP